MVQSVTHDVRHQRAGRDDAEAARLEVFDRGRVAIVMDNDKFLGLITRTDLLSYLRLNMPKSSVPPTREYN